MNPKLFLPLALAASLLPGCKSVPVAEPIPPQPPIDPAPITITSAYSIREPEQLRRVIINRYVDPNNPNVMHEGHELYVRSQSATWNTRPNAPLRDDFETGRLTIAAPVEAEYALQTEALAERDRQLQKFGEALVASRKDMIDAVKELKAVRAELNTANAATAARVAQLEKTISDLKRTVANVEAERKK